MARRILHRSKIYPITQYGNPWLWHYTVAGRNALRSLIRKRQKRIAKGKRRASFQLTGTLKKSLLGFDKNKKKKYQQIKGNAAGTTKSTTSMIVRKTPREQRFLRKMFKNGSSEQLHVQRFGFSWVGAYENNKTIWYSVCHLKLNNILDYYFRRSRNIDESAGIWSNSQYSSNSNNPANFIYIGKCTFQYELYNPTNYNITVYIYDLICKHDTPYDIKYGNNIAANNSAPEMEMYTGSRSYSLGESPNNFTIADPTLETGGGDGNNENPTPTVWDTVGMKPTDFMAFNVTWKVKAIKKLILPPGTSHHHNVIFNPKKKVTFGNLVYPRFNVLSENGLQSKNGIAGLTQATLFGFEGQVAINDGEDNDNNVVGTLPGKIVVKCIRKIHTHSFPMTPTTIVAKNDLRNLMEPKIFTDLQESAPVTI